MSTGEFAAIELSTGEFFAMEVSEHVSLSTLETVENRRPKNSSLNHLFKTHKKQAQLLQHKRSSLEKLQCPPYLQKSCI